MSWETAALIWLGGVIVIAAVMAFVLGQPGTTLPPRRQLLLIAGLTAIWPIVLAVVIASLLLDAGKFLLEVVKKPH